MATRTGRHALIAFILCSLAACIAQPDFPSAGHPAQPGRHAGGVVCAADLQPCSADSDCCSGLACVAFPDSQARCRLPSLHSGAGTVAGSEPSDTETDPPATQPSSGQLGDPCTYDQECYSGYCAGGLCSELPPVADDSSECSSPSDCDAGYDCQGGSCVASADDTLPDPTQSNDPPQTVQADPTQTDPTVTAPDPATTPDDTNSDTTNTDDTDPDDDCSNCA